MPNTARLYYRAASARQTIPWYERLELCWRASLESLLVVYLQPTKKQSQPAK